MIISVNKVVLRKYKSIWLIFFFSASFWNFKTCAKTELCFGPLPSAKRPRSSHLLWRSFGNPHSLHLMFLDCFPLKRVLIERGIYPNFGNYACPVRSRKLWQRQRKQLDCGSRNYAQVTFQLVPGPRFNFPALTKKLWGVKQYNESLFVSLTCKYLRSFAYIYF